jgi:hypothetical protein
VSKEAELQEAKAHLREIQREMRENAGKFLLEGLNQTAGISASALALLVTFRNALLGGDPNFVWMIKWSWVCLGVALVASIWSKFMASEALSAAHEEETSSNMTKLKARSVSWLAMTGLVAFGLGVAGLVAFGWANL